MNTTVDALKALYVALGGTSSTVENVTTIPDMITAIASLGAVAVAGAGAISVDSSGRTIIKAADDKDLIIKTTGNGNLAVQSENELSLEGGDGLYMRATGGDINLDADDGDIDMTADSRLSLNSLGSFDAEAQGGDFRIIASDDNDLKLIVSGDATLNDKAIATTE